MRRLINAYSLFPKYYDQLFRTHPKLYARARRKLLGEVLREAQSVCELGCGTGTTALEFARRGLRVFGVDRSPAMCQVARQKAWQAKLPVQILRADMRAFRLPEQVDLVTCEFDALNHVPRKNDLGRVLHAVARALRPGGWFLFDVNTRQAFQKRWTRVWFAETRQFTLVTYGGYDRRRARGWLRFEWFVPARGAWQRYTESYEEVAWTGVEIRAALRRAGFAQVRNCDAEQVFQGAGAHWAEPGCRVFYLARKRG